MRTYIAARLVGTLGFVAATVVAVGFLASYDDGIRFFSTDPFVKRLPSIRYELRHEQTGEVYRGHMLDRDGLARQVRVQFKDGGHGIKYTTGTGVLVGVKEFLKDGSYIVYDIESDGKTSNHQRWFSKDNVLLRDRRVGTNKAVQVTVFAADGQTPTVVEEQADGTTSKIFLHGNGQPRAKFKLQSDSAVEFVVLSETGSLLYSETASAQTDHECGSQDIQVVVYGDGGKVALKQFYQSDPGGQGANLVKVEEYSADGKSVAREVEVEGESATVTTIAADGTKTTAKLPLAEVPPHLVSEPVNPAKDIESKLMDTFDFPLRAANMLN